MSNKSKRYFPHTTLQAIIVVLFIFVYSSLLVFLKKVLLKNNEMSNEMVITIISFIALLATIITVYFINYKRKIKLSFNFNLKNTYLLFIAITIVIFFQIGLVKPLIHIVNPLFHINSIPKNPFQSVSMLISSLFLAPILEEIIFRGVILKGFLTNYSPKKAIVISSLVFGILHLGPIQFINALFIGLFLGWIYYKTNSLGNTIILHFIANTFSLFAGYLNFKFGTKEISNTYGEWSIYIIFGAIILTTFLLIKMFKYVKTI